MLLAIFQPVMVSKQQMIADCMPEFQMHANVQMVHHFPLPLHHGQPQTFRIPQSDSTREPSSKEEFAARP
jgi:hypothetical protein